MWKYVNDTLMQFRKCFSREKAFRWFAVTVLALMLWLEHDGVTSIIRTLGINPNFYENLVHFFHASSWKLDSIIECWVRIVFKSGFVYRVAGKPVTVGDGVKKSKEGRKISCVKKLHQESENSGKAEYIHGQMFGAVGVILNNFGKFFCCLLSMRFHDGNEVVGKWAGDEKAEYSHVVRLIYEAFAIFVIAGVPSILLLDSYFLSIPAMEAYKILTEQHGNFMTIVTRGTAINVAFEEPPGRTGKRGAPRKKGKKVKLIELFESEKSSFITGKVNIYGKCETVSYLVKDLLWGEGLYIKLRFVLVNLGKKKVILVCTDLFMSPLHIIELYSKRFKIECSFRSFNQVIAGFASRFWSTAAPKLDRFVKNVVMSERLAAVPKEMQSKIVSAYKATEGFVMMACIALGMLQLVSLLFGEKINVFRWLRTQRNILPSEATAADFMRKTFFRKSCFKSDLEIASLIQSVQMPDDEVNSQLDSCG